jgi:hypothetical protein
MLKWVINVEGIRMILVCLDGSSTPEKVFCAGLQYLRNVG